MQTQFADENRYPMKRLAILQKKRFPHYEFSLQKCTLESCFFRHKIIIYPDKSLVGNCLFISKSISFNLTSILNHWLTFSLGSNNYETSSSSKG